MNVLLNTTFLIIIGFSVLNFLLSLSFYYTTKLKLHGLQAAFWFSLIFNFFIQGSASEAGETQVILSFAFSIVPVTFLSLISFKIADVQFPKKAYGILYTFLILLNLVLVNLPLPFIWKSLPISLAVAIPLFHSSYNLLITNMTSRTAFQRLMGIILFLNGVNGINFAVFRMEPDAQLWGWIVAYALYQLIAVFLPALSLEFNNRTEKDRLERMVDQKTLHLKEANNKLDLLFKQNSLLLRVLLHDISNSIVVMSFQIGKLANKFNMNVDPSYCQETVGKLEKRLDILVNLITQVKDYEGVKSGKCSLDKAKIEFSEIKNELNERFKEQLEVKKLQFEFSQPNNGKELCIYADRSSFFNSIVSNLITNAIKFSPIGSKINIDMFEEDSYDVLKIINTGKPIPKNLIPKLFSFEDQTSQLGTCGERGTGFGLPILHEYMTLHRGIVEVLSEGVDGSLDGMTVFTLKFPKITEPHEEGLGN